MTRAAWAQPARHPAARVDPAGALAGRREAALLALPSVGHMAEVLARRCGEPSWVRALVASLDRFRVLAAGDLEGLLAAARRDPGVAEARLEAFARALDGHPDAAVAGLAVGPKVWFRLGGVPVAWRPLPARASQPPPLPAASPLERLALLGLIGSGLHLSELLRLRVGDVGALDADGGLEPDPEAEPLAVRYRRLGRGARERITFLSFHARGALVAELARRRAAGQDTGPHAPLLAGPQGQPATAATVRAARRRSGALIRAGGAVNVELCRTTGEFFRTWGLPGARFVPVPDHHGGATP